MRAIEIAVCQAEWLDNDTLLFTGLPGCNTGFNAPGITWTLDINTGISVQMNSGLDGIIWLLPNPDVEVANLSPKANVGFDQNYDGSK